MSVSNRNVHRPDNRALRPHHLAACLAAALGLGSLVTPAIAANIVVHACSDADIFIGGGGPIPIILFGLRSSVTYANSGDTIDMTGLTACTITLTNGEIPITVNDLTIKGPPGHPVTINGGAASRIFNHSGTGIVRLSYLTLYSGYSDPPASGSDAGHGGCVISKGSVYLAHSTVHGCVAKYGSAISSVGVTNLTATIAYNNFPSRNPIGNYVGGSGVIASGGGTIVSNFSQISHNSGWGIIGGGADLNDGSSVNDNSYGGVFVSGNVKLDGSTIDGNAGPGIRTSSPVTVNSSTISNNSTQQLLGGGIMVTGAVPLTITNSTISGNTATKGGGIYANNNAQINISNSTIAYNSGGYAGGIDIASCSSFTLRSSIIAKNLVTGGSPTSTNSDLVSACFVAGAPDSLVGVHGTLLPTGTRSGDPGLTPLAANGGWVKTHALLPTSQAIDHGSNPQNLTTDERGNGFPRVQGTAADIGAYERNPDEIFYNGFQ